MGVLVYVLGRTGTGKSYSMRNFPKDKLAVVNVQGKILPFKDSGKIEITNTDDCEDIKTALDVYSKSFKSIIVDDFQYVMANEFMRRAMERGYDKFTEIGAHAWQIADKVRELPSDVIVYVLCHTDIDAEGTERLKTIGKLLDEKIFLEGMSTIVLKTNVTDNKYSFVTQNNGKDTVKSPADMFPSYAIDNDLWYVDQKIREYYGLGATISSDELKKKDTEAAHTDIEKPEKKKRGNRRSENPEVKAVKEKNSEIIANANVSDEVDEIPYEEAEEPKLEQIPRRKRRQPTAEAETENAEGENSEIVETVEKEPEGTEVPRRRRRRG